MRTVDYYTQKIVKMAFLSFLSFPRKRESRDKNWIPCQARNDGRKHLHSNERGFTLIELVITMVLIGIVAYVVASALSTGIKAYFVTDFRKEALDQARIAMERMTREIRNVRSSADVPTGINNQFCFTDINGTRISFRYDGASNILRGEGGAGCPGAVENTLAASITSFLFEYVDNTGVVVGGFLAGTTRRIRITLTSTISGESVTLQSEVWPRNL